MFNTPGRYQYFCTPHKDFMKGVIEVGTDAVVDSLDNFKSKRTGKRVKLSFLLNEAATVTYTLKGPVAPDGQARPPGGRHAQLHGAAPEARHLPRRAHRRGRLRQEGHTAELLRRTLRS